MCLLIFELCYCFFFKQKTAYEMRISDWSSDVCSSDLQAVFDLGVPDRRAQNDAGRPLLGAPQLRHTGDVDQGIRLGETKVEHWAKGLPPRPGTSLPRPPPQKS